MFASHIEDSIRGALMQSKRLKYELRMVYGSRSVQLADQSRCG